MRKQIELEDAPFKDRQRTKKTEPVPEPESIVLFVDEAHAQKTREQIEVNRENIQFTVNEYRRLIGADPEGIAWLVGNDCRQTALPIWESRQTIPPGLDHRAYLNLLTKPDFGLLESFRSRCKVLHPDLYSIGGDGNIIVNETIADKLCRSNDLVIVAGSRQHRIHEVGQKLLEAVRELQELAPDSLRRDVTGQGFILGLNIEPFGFEIRQGVIQQNTNKFYHLLR